MSILFSTLFYLSLYPSLIRSPFLLSVFYLGLFALIASSFLLKKDLFKYRVLCYTKLHAKEYAPVAQLDRALDSDSKGHAFESHRAYQTADWNECHSSLLFSFILFGISLSY